MKHTTPTILTWPLWSRRNLAITGLLALTLLAILGRLAGGSDPLPVHAASVSAPTGHTAQPSGLSTGQLKATRSATVTSAAPVANQPQDVAAAFVTRWARPSLAADQWRADLEALATGPLFTSMRYTDPARVPASRVVGAAVLVQATDTTALVRVPTNGGTLEVTLRRIDGRWKTDQIMPADQPPTMPPPDVRPTPSAGG